MSSADVQRPLATPGSHYEPLPTVLTPTKQAPDNRPHDVVTIFNYFKDNEDGSPPEPNYAIRPEGFTDRPVEQKKATVHDIRGSEDKYTLDTTGFQVVKHESKEKNFLDEKQIRAVYYPETEELLKKTTGASKIFIFDHTIRRQSQDSHLPPQERNNRRGPVQRVHIDQSYRAAPNRVKIHLPEEAETLLRGRYQIINVWRPIKTILKDPLGIAEASSVREEELVPIKLIYPDKEGETFSVRAGPTHKWYYLYKQTPEEVVLVKCFDSKTDGRARRVPHSAFVNEEFENEDPRESIEIRALVFHPDDSE